MTLYALSISTFSRCSIMCKTCQQPSGISTASWNLRRSSSLSWCQVRAAPPALLTQGRPVRAFAVPEFSTGHRGEQTSPETCTVSAWVVKTMVLWAKEPHIMGSKRLSLPFPILQPVWWWMAAGGPEQDRLHPAALTHKSPFSLCYLLEKAFQAGQCIFPLPETFVAFSKRPRWGSAVPYSRCWSTYGSFSSQTAHFLNVIILGTKQRS